MEIEPRILAHNALLVYYISPDAGPIHGISRQTLAPTIKILHSRNQAGARTNSALGQYHFLCPAVAAQASITHN
jgi:hypothetical protein